MTCNQMILYIMQSMNSTDEEEVNGRRDFEKLTKHVEFEPSQSFQRVKLFLPFTDDNIHELDEGFIIEVKVDERQPNHPQDVAGIKYRFDGVSLIRIVNDDGELHVSSCVELFDNLNRYSQGMQNSVLIYN